MIKLYYKKKLIQSFKSLNISNIKDCQKVLRTYGITSKYPGIDIMGKARAKGFNLQSY